jgi:cytochrome b561
MAILILAQVILGKIGHEMARSPAKIDVLAWHKSLGITLLFLVLLRLAWRWLNMVPATPAAASPWELRAARFAHAALYALMIALPFSGWVMNSAKNIPMTLFWTLPWPDITAPNKPLGEAAEKTHEILAIVMLLIVALHVIAALRHHLLHRDGVLLRMLPSARAKP